MEVSLLNNNIHNHVIMSLSPGLLIRLSLDQSHFGPSFTESIAGILILLHDPLQANW